MASSSSIDNKSLLSVKEKAMQYLYPAPVARYEDIIASPKLFMDSLTKFHVAMGTKFKIPIVGGRDLDLHRLFVEVTSRGGITNVVEEKKWREVTNGFNFPPSATNASFILRKYYTSLIQHFEQAYYFKAKAWTPVATNTLQGATNTLSSTRAMHMLEIQNPSPEVQVTSVKRQRMTTDDSLLSKGSVESPVGLPVTGIIDGKFESGYLCTVRIGGEQLQGVLYQTVQAASNDMIPNHAGVVTLDATQGSTMVRRRRRRRKKSEMRKRDPAHPKPNRSGYNFFFAEQHGRLKLLHTGKDRAISRMIGEEWNKLTESDRAVYQEKAVKDKERYRREMEHYREGFNRGPVLTNAVPVQQHYYMVDPSKMVVENNGGNSHQVHDPNSEFSDGDNDTSFEDEEKTTGKDLNLEMGTENIDIVMKPHEEILFAEKKKSLILEDDQSMFFVGSDQQKSTSVQENEPLVVENESSRILENESKKEEKSPDDERVIPDISDENNTKLAANQEKDLVKSDGTVETRPVVSEEKFVQNVKEGQSLNSHNGAE